MFHSSLGRLGIGVGVGLRSTGKLIRLPDAHPTPLFHMGPEGPGSGKFQTLIYVPVRPFAARKGTRTRKEKKKVKKEEDVKKVFMFKSVRKEMEQPYVNQRPLDDSKFLAAVDDVFLSYKFKTIRYPFGVAIQNLKEVNHPTMYNLPSAPVLLKVNVDLVYPNRPNKFQDGWRSIIEMKAPFILEGMVRPSVLAFCAEDVDQIAEVVQAGADLAGSKEIIKKIQEGEINSKDYEYIVAHPSIVPDLSAIRGLIKKTFPTVKNRTISTDLVAEVIRLKSGVKIRLEKSDREPDFGFFEIPIGKLDMSIEELESNFLSVLRDTYPRRVPGKEPEEFVISCLLQVIHNQGRQRESFRVDLSPYLDEFRRQGKKPAASSSPFDEVKETPENEPDAQQQEDQEKKKSVSS